MTAIPYEPAMRTRRDGSVDVAWLERSYAEPDWLRSALRARLRETGEPGLESTADGVANLYRDAVARHVGAGRVAFRSYDRFAGWRALSYDDLHALSARRAASWAAQGVEPGAVIAAVLPMGAELVIALLAGWRLGACMSWIPPYGTVYLGRRLAALGPQHIASDSRYDALLVDVADLVLDARAGVQIGIRSYPYAADEPCALVFSPLRAPLDAPTPLSAQSAVECALRDGLVTLALRPGDAIAAPGMDTPQHQPCLLLAALVAGATFVHISERDVEREPELLYERSLRACGVTNAVADALLKAKLDRAPPWQHWFRNPEQPTDWVAWRDFVDRYELGDTPMSNLVLDTALGGAVLTSPRREFKLQQQFFMNVFPAPAQPWTLLDFTGSGQRSITAAGVLSQTEDDAPIGPDHIVLAQRRAGEYLYCGNVEPRRAGCVYPTDDVLAAVADADFLRAASVVPVLSGGVASHWRFALVVFTGAEPLAVSDDRREARTRELERLIRARVGAHALPDACELFGLHARLADDGADHAWCAAQYLSGSLFRKARRPMFQYLTTVREPYMASAAPEASA